MIVQGPRLWIRASDGIVEAVAFYDNADGAPARLDTTRTTARAYEVELQGTGAAQKMVLLVPAGAASTSVPNPVAKNIDMRPDGATENASEWTFTLRV